MYEHAQQSMTRRRKRGLFGDLFKQPVRVNERFCPHCKQPYQPGPQPEPIYKVIRHNLTALLYPAGSWSRQSLVLRFGRWRASSSHFYLSEYVPTEELPVFIEVAEEMQAYLIEAAKATKQKRS